MRADDIDLGEREIEKWASRLFLYPLMAILIAWGAYNQFYLEATVVRFHCEATAIEPGFPEKRERAKGLRPDEKFTSAVGLQRNGRVDARTVFEPAASLEPQDWFGTWKIEKGNIDKVEQLWFSFGGPNSKDVRLSAELFRSEDGKLTGTGLIVRDDVTQSMLTLVSCIEEQN